MRVPVLQSACLQPASNQADETRVSYSMLHKPEHPVVTQAPEKVLQVRLQHPFHFPPGNHLMKGGQRVMGTPPRPSPKRARQKILLVDGGQYLSGASLKRPVCDTRHAQRAFLMFSGLRDIHAPDVRRLVSLTVNG